jgi:hypothetical protein
MLSSKGAESGKKKDEAHLHEEARNIHSLVLRPASVGQICMELGHERTSKLAVIEGQLWKMKGKYTNSFW